MHPWNTAVKNALTPISNADNAAQMKAYLRDQFEFFGIQAGPRRAAIKPIFTNVTLPPVEDLVDVIDELWSLPEREYQMVAIDLLVKMKQHLAPTTLPDLERWITTKSWWDTVDMLGTHVTGSFYQRHPEETMVYIERWRRSDNIWLRRTTLLFQLKYKEATDVKLLFELIRENKHDKEFFIQKAIGWVLREYSKIDSRSVIDFIDSENIQGLARREGLKWLNNQALKNT